MSQTKRQKTYDWGRGAINRAASPAASLPPRHWSLYKCMVLMEEARLQVGLLAQGEHSKCVLTPPRLASKQNRNFLPKGEGRSGRRPLLPKRKLNILVDLTLGKSYHSVVTFLHAQKIKCYTFSIHISSKLISYYVCP